MLRAMALPLCFYVTAIAQTQVDAVVTDQNGRRVPDLTATDFIVLQDGKPRPITQFANIREQPETRNVILVDDLTMDARPQLAGFIGPATVVCLSRRSGAHLDHALDFVRPPTPFTTLLGDIPLARELRDMLFDLDDLPGRKSLVVIAGPNRGAHSIDVSAMADIASRASVTIYHLGGSEALSALAAATGGWTVRQLDDAIAPAPYYTIGWDAGSTRRFQVHTRDKKLQVHMRAPASSGHEPPMLAASGQLRRALASPLTGGELDVNLTAAFVRQEAAGSYVDLLLHIGRKGVHFEPDTNGCGRARLEIMRALWPLDPGLAPSERVATSPVEVTTCGGTGIVATVRERVPSTGAYMARVAVRNQADRTGHIPIGSAAQFLVVPKDAVLSAITLWSGDTPPGSAGDLAARPARDGDPAVRVFHIGDELHYAVQVLGAAGDVRAQILPNGTESSGATGSMALQGLKPGRYVLRASLTGKTRADEYIDFEIR